MGRVEPRQQEVESRGFSHRGEEEHEKEREREKKQNERSKKNLTTIKVYTRHPFGWMDGRTDVKYYRDNRRENMFSSLYLLPAATAEADCLRTTLLQTTAELHQRGENKADFPFNGLRAPSCFLTLFCIKP